MHDLTNRKSEGNLRKWLAEVLTKECNGNALSSVRINPTRNQEIDEYDPEQFIGSSQVFKFSRQFYLLVFTTCYKNYADSNTCCWD